MKIMFVMLRTLGDVVVGTTICRELKRDYPDSEIHYFTNKAYAEILANNPYIDKVRISEEWLLDMLFMEMANGGYDMIFAPYQVRRECNAWHQVDATRHQHLVDFYWKRMGMHRPIKERECYIFPSDEDFKSVENLISTDVPRVAIHTTSGVVTKDWPYFDYLVEELRLAGFACVQVGSPKDKTAIGAVDFRGKISLMRIAALLSKCSAFVGIDSGISYMADAMKTPSIIIQGSTNPVTSGPISERVIHLFAEKTGYEDCQEIRCHANCFHEINCNTTIKPDHVMQKLIPIIEKRNIIPVQV